MIKVEDLRNTWRIILLTIVGQLIGILVAITIELHHNPFLSLLIGGAFGTLPGFIIGFFWHFSDIEKRKNIPFFSVSIILAGALLLPYIAYQFFTAVSRHMNPDDIIQSLNQSSISSLSIKKVYEDSDTLTITDKDQIISFVESCSDIQDNFKQYNDNCNGTFYNISIKSDMSVIKGMILQYCHTDIARGAFSIKEGEKTQMFGSFTSKKLKIWLHKYVAPNYGD